MQTWWWWWWNVHVKPCLNAANKLKHKTSIVFGACLFQFMMFIHCSTFTEQYKLITKNIFVCSFVFVFMLDLGCSPRAGWEFAYITTVSWTYLNSGICSVHTAGLGCMTMSQTDPPPRLHLLGANWQAWHLKLKLSLSQKVGCTAHAITQSRTSVHLGWVARDWADLNPP